MSFELVHDHLGLGFANLSDGSGRVAVETGAPRYRDGFEVIEVEYHSTTKGDDDNGLGLRGPDGMFELGVCEERLRIADARVVVGVVVIAADGLGAALW